MAFKEGLCYGKAEAAGLFFITPALMLGHLTGLIPERGQQGLLAAFVVMFTIFAARKYTQVGDGHAIMCSQYAGPLQFCLCLAMPPLEGECACLTTAPSRVPLAAQAIEDDIGDKSVFELMKLPAEEQQRKLAEMGRGS